MVSSLEITMQKSQLSKDFLLAMVTSMYRYEAHQVRDPSLTLLTDAEMEDFYAAFMGVAP